MSVSLFSKERYSYQRRNESWTNPVDISSKEEDDKDSFKCILNNCYKHNATAINAKHQSIYDASKSGCIKLLSVLLIRDWTSRLWDRDMS